MVWGRDRAGNEYDRCVECGRDSVKYAGAGCCHTCLDRAEVEGRYHPRPHRVHGLVGLYLAIIDLAKLDTERGYETRPGELAEFWTSEWVQFMFDYIEHQTHGRVLFNREALIGEMLERCDEH